MSRTNRFDRDTFHGVDLVRNGVFVETGFYLGESFAYALTLPFQSFHSCDVCLLYTLSEGAQAWRADGCHIRNQDSPTFLRELLNGPNRTRPITFWLDAHYQGGCRSEMSPGVECPLLDELRVIFDPALPWNVPPIVLIDDASMFNKRHWTNAHYGKFNLEQWPTREEIAALIPAHYTITEEDDVLWCLPCP